PTSLLGRAKDETLLLYPEFGPVGARRTIRDTRGSDFAIAFESKVSGSDGDSWSPLATVKVTGVAEAAAKLKSKSVVSDKPEVKVVVHTNDLGAFEVVKAEALFNVTNPGHAAYLEDLAAWEAETAAASAAASTTASAIQSETDSAKLPKARAKPVPQPETITEVVKLELEVEYHGPPRMSSDALEQSRSLLRRMDEDDTARSARHGAANQLESLIYRLRDEIEEDALAAVTTESQREALEKAIGSASEWLENNAESAAVDALKAQLAVLKALWDPIVYRQTQHTKRAESVASLKKGIAQAADFVARIRKELPSVEADADIKLLDDVDAAVSSARKWLDAGLARQNALSPSDDPVLLAEDIERQAELINSALATLLAEQLKKAAAAAPKASRDSSSKAAETKKEDEAVDDATAVHGDDKAPPAEQAHDEL
ncbi:lumenal Hsp70 protein, partial [Coemansia spiralis]